MTIPFETGIPSLLKEKGFDVKTEKYFNTIENDTAIMQSTYKVNFNGIRAHTSHTSAPDYDQVLDWLDEKHGIKLWAEYDTNFNKWMDVSTGIGYGKITYHTRYEALNEGIKEGLKLINK